MLCAKGNKIEKKAPWQPLKRVEGEEKDYFPGDKDEYISYTWLFVSTFGRSS